MAKTTHIILSAAVAGALLLSLAVFIYVNLPPPQTEQDSTTPLVPSTTLLTVSFNGSYTNYTLDDLEALEPITGSGGYIKTKVLPTVSTTGPFEYTGVPLLVLLEHLQGLPNNYSITVTSIDNYSRTYTLSEIKGIVPMYNDAGEVLESGEVTMVLVYKENDEYINDTDVGPLRIAYVDEGAFTPSEFWLKMVTLIEVTPGT
ncbi:MAG: hypothetical protein JXA00_03370 [Candidatus Thermoplasmatota archaeon]|nr:hypothetical protein [Candidatus Thermoplasmatota archaeon]